MSEPFLSAEQLEHAAHNLFRYETGFDREGWHLLTDDERQGWRDRALASLGDYAMLSREERDAENLRVLDVTLGARTPESHG